MSNKENVDVIPGILKQERYPVFEKSITKYFELSILCEEQ